MPRSCRCLHRPLRDASSSADDLVSRKMQQTVDAFGFRSRTAPGNPFGRGAALLQHSAMSAEALSRDRSVYAPTS
jgi:hypothetical protein